MSDEIKHSFLVGYGAGENPPEFQHVEAGYLKSKELPRDKWPKTTHEIRKAKRAKRLERIRNRRYYRERKARMAANGPGKHPTLKAGETVALVEAMNLA